MVTEARFLDPAWRYRRAADTNVGETFARVRAEQERERSQDFAREPESAVTPRGQGKESVSRAPFVKG